MGRPINKKFFGNLASPYDNAQTGGSTGIGGESVSTITVSNSGTNYSSGTTVTISAPQIKGGTQATISYSRNVAGSLSVAVVGGGTGYTSASLTVTPATEVTKAASTGTDGATTIYVTNTNGIYVGMAVSGTNVGTGSVVTVVSTGQVTVSATNADAISGNVTFTDEGASFASSVALTSTTQNALAFTSYLTTGSNAVTGGDIMKQEASRRYLVNNSEGIGQVKLVATDALAAGQMNLIATDGAGSTFFVTKLTARKATVVGRTGTSTAVVVSGAAVGWTLGVATGTNQVTLSSN